MIKTEIVTIINETKIYVEDKLFFDAVLLKTEIEKITFDEKSLFASGFDVILSSSYLSCALQNYRNSHPL